MIFHPMVLSSSDEFPWPVLIGLVVFVLFVIAKIRGSASRQNSAAVPPKPPLAPIPPALFAGVQAGRFVAPPPPPARRVRRAAGPPPPLPRPKADVAAPDTSAFPEARASVAEARTEVRSSAQLSPGSSIRSELRSRGSIRTAVILTELLEPPAVLRDEPGP